MANYNLTLERAKEWLVELAKNESEKANILWCIDVIAGAERPPVDAGPPAQPAPEGARPCTCHPDDSPPVPCAKKYAYAECVAAVQPETPLHVLRYSLYSQGVTWCDECKRHVYILDKGHVRQ